MARKRKGRNINGVVLVDKYSGESSNFILQRVKRIFGAAKAGHTGALDPLATGMLPICLGEATKFSQFLLEADKTYEVTAKLGQRTDTSDADGEVVETRAINCTEQDIRAAVATFIGPIKQVPSMFSALKYQGKPLYTYARQGIEVPREARDITIHSADILRIAADEIDLRVSCTKGTYIRSLVDDLGQLLGCGAHVTVLRRTQVAQYPAANMLSVEALENLQVQGEDGPDYTQLDSLLMPMETAITHLPAEYIDDPSLALYLHGQAVPAMAAYEDESLVRVYAKSSDTFYGIASYQQNKLQPKRIVVY